MTVEERILAYGKVKVEILSTPDGAKKYLASTGIYTEDGELTDEYKTE